LHGCVGSGKPARITGGIANVAMDQVLDQFGITGMIIPSPITSISSVAKINPKAAWRFWGTGLSMPQNSNSVLNF